MNIPKDAFDIIGFEADERKYYPSQKQMDQLKKYWSAKEQRNNLLYSDMEIPLGHSRYGGCVIDLPKNEPFPLAPEEYDHPTYQIAKDGFDANYLRFVAQFDMEKVGAQDKTGRLPKTGQLYFFADIYNEKGHVCYVDVAADELERVIVKHDDIFYVGCLVKEFAAQTERFQDRSRPLDVGAGETECGDCGEDFRSCGCNSEFNEFQMEDLTPDGRVYDMWVGAETSKFFGIFTELQANSMEEIVEMTCSDQLLLLQIGENGFNEEGIFYVGIPKEDLKHLNFDNCTFRWSQT
ncbi:DUF1963 domain-containing protein [Maribacter sp. 2307ULW6-5]|uniref:DUF1963 domain-containing protein n=1 Tax=Maribacter sp. 2307ULW6-5 TaxID=3386275 RepID=UPI0039BD87D6